MKGMHCEDCGNKSTLPDCACHALKQPEQQQSGQNMQDYIDDVITAGVETEQMIIQH